MVHNHQNWEWCWPEWRQSIASEALTLLTHELMRLALASLQTVLRSHLIITWLHRNTFNHHMRRVVFGEDVLHFVISTFNQNFTRDERTENSSSIFVRSVYPWHKLVWSFPHTAAPVSSSLTLILFWALNVPRFFWHMLHDRTGSVSFYSELGWVKFIGRCGQKQEGTGNSVGGVVNTGATTLWLEG